MHIRQLFCSGSLLVAAILSVERRAEKTMKLDGKKASNYLAFLLF
jgi:hypothetical protein